MFKAIGNNGKRNAVFLFGITNLGFANFFLRGKIETD